MGRKVLIDEEMFDRLIDIGLFLVDRETTLAEIQHAKEQATIKPIVDIDGIKNDLDRYKGRDLNATIQLCYDDGFNPFARETLRHVDVSVSDNIYVVESDVIGGLQKELEVTRKALEISLRAQEGLYPHDIDELVEQARKELDNG